MHIMISSGWPAWNYGMSKLGVIAYARVLARNEPSLLVNACCPGYVKTDMSGGKGYCLMN